MKISGTSRRPAIVAAVSCAMVVALFTVVEPIVADHFWRETTLGLEWYLGAPAGLLLSGSGIAQTSLGYQINNIYFAGFVNGLLAGLIMFVLARVGQFFWRDEIRKETGVGAK